jgi:hypothetical protein
MMFLLANFRHWASRIGRRSGAAGRAARKRQSRIILGDTLPRTGPEAEQIRRGFSRGICPVCGSREFTSEERLNDKFLWSCGNPTCGAEYMVAEVSGYRFVELVIASKVASIRQ